MTATPTSCRASSTTGPTRSACRSCGSCTPRCASGARLWVVEKVLDPDPPRPAAEQADLHLVDLQHARPVRGTRAQRRRVRRPPHRGRVRPARRALPVRTLERHRVDPPLIDGGSACWVYACSLDFVSLRAMTSSRAEQPGGPGLLDALSLLSEVADELVVRTARDTHYALADRVHGFTRRGGPRSVPDQVHRGIAAAVYGGLSLGLRAASTGLDKVAATGAGPRLEGDTRGRFVSSAVNGLIGDRLVRERPRLAIPMAVRAHGSDVLLDRPGLAGAFPDATGRVVVFLHGLCENESYWNRGRDVHGTTYGEALAAEGWTPVFLRANTGLGLRENGVALSALRAAARRGVADAGGADRAGRPLDGRTDHPRRRRRGDRGRQAVDRAGLRRDHARHPSPRRPDRPRHRARQSGDVGAARDGGVRPDPRLALRRRARPRRRAGRGRAAAAARPLPPGRRRP